MMKLLVATAAALLLAPCNFADGYGQSERQRRRAAVGAQRQEGGDGGGSRLPPCNQELSEAYSRDDMMRALQFYLGVLMRGDQELVQAEMAALGPSILYGARVYKLCASCGELADEGGDEETAEARSEPSSLYPPAASCSASVYGHDARHSAVVMIPVDDDTGGIVSGSRLRGFLRMHASLGPYGVPTDLWPPGGVRGGWLAALSESPGNGTTVAGDVAEAIAPYIAAMVAASAGAVSVLPDYLGYGESRQTHNMTVAVAEHYQQAAVVSYRGAQRLVRKATGGCAALDDVATVSGFSEGGFGSIAAAAALQETGVRVLRLFVNAPLLDLENQTLHVLRYFDEGLIDVTRNNYAFRYAFPFGVFCYSAETPGLANTGTGQVIVDPGWADPANFSRNLLGWFQSPDPLSYRELDAVVPDDAVVVVNPDFLALLRLGLGSDGIPSPCRSEFVTEGVTDKLCEALLAGSVRSMLMNATFPVGLCFSPDDSYVDPAQFDAELLSRPHIARLGGPGGVDVRGDHWETGFSCGHSAIEFLAGRARPDDPDERGTYMAPIEGGGGPGCAAEESRPPAETTSAPGLTPASASARSSLVSMYSWPGAAVLLLLLPGVRGGRI